VVENLPSNYKAPNSNPSTAKTKQNKKGWTLILKNPQNPKTSYVEIILYVCQTPKHSVKHMGRQRGNIYLHISSGKYEVIQPHVNQ
jgi:hypothetical protein